jgi:hypothetical protein
MVKEMKESEIVNGIREKFTALLSEVPFFEQIWVRGSVNPEDTRADLRFQLYADASPLSVLVEVKSTGEPRQARSAIQQLREYLSRVDDAYGVFAAPYISDYTAQLCKDSGVGYMDLAGNCLLSFDRVYVERRNYPNPNTEKRQLRSLFGPKSSRVLRVMLKKPKRAWQVQDLAEEADVSLGLAFKIKERLLALEYAREDRKRIKLARPADLLDTWAENYSFRSNKLYDYFSFDEPKTMERKLAQYCRRNEITYALTMFSGAALVAPFARYTRAFAYVAEGIEELAAALQLKEAPSGPNFTILAPYDDGVFYGSRTVKGLRVVCDIQLYLDLAGYKGRGEESARFLLDQRIKRLW